MKIFFIIIKFNKKFQLKLINLPLRCSQSVKNKHEAEHFRYEPYFPSHFFCPGNLN